MDGSILHEYQCKLRCLTVEAEYAIETLLGFYSVRKKKKIIDPDEAFTAIVSDCHNDGTLKNVKKLFTNKDYKKQCFDLNIPSQLKTKIYINELDITISSDFLLFLDVFPTCKKTQLICKNFKNGGRHNNACCNICNICNKCRKLQCKSAVMREAVDFIKMCRNFTAHLTFAVCEKMEKGNYNCITIPGCHVWNHVLVKYKNAIRTVLQYLKKSVLHIKIDSRCSNLNIIVDKNSNVYWNLYDTSMNKIVRENVAILNSKDNIIKQTLGIDIDFKKVKATGFWGYLLYILSNVAGLFSSHQQIPFGTFDMDDACMEQVYTGSKEKIGKILELELPDNSAKFDIGRFGSRSLFSEHLGIHMEIHIEFCNEPPECYNDPYSSETKSLRKRIKFTVAELICAVFKLDVDVKCTNLAFSSLHISLDILKLDKQQWSDEDRTKICSFLEKDEKIWHEINILLKENMGDIYSFDIVTSSDIPLPNTLTMEVGIQVYEEEILDQINSIWPTVLSKIEKFLSDDVFNGTYVIEACSSDKDDFTEEDFVNFEDGKAFYLPIFVVMAQSNLYLMYSNLLNHNK